MKILIHTDEYYPTPQACAYRMKVLADAFTAAGNDVTVIASAVNRANGEIGDHAERIIYVPAARMRKKTTLLRLLNNLSFAVTSLFSAFAAGRADVVITTSPPLLISLSGWIIARCKGAKLVFDIRDIWPDVATEMGNLRQDGAACCVFRRIADFMYRHSDAVTTVSPGKVEKIRAHLRRLHVAAEGKTVLFGNGFDERVLQCRLDSALMEKYAPPGVFSCVYIGNIGLAQGLDVLLRLAKETSRPEARFLLFGDGAQRAELAEKAAAEELKNVSFCGVLPHEKVLSVLSAAQLSFIPLKNANMRDSIPTKIYEALGIGCPVLLVAEGDACRVVEEAELGCCVSPDHPERLAEVFDEMVGQYARYDEQRRAGARELMKRKYSRQQIAKAYEAWLHDLTGKN